MFAIPIFSLTIYYNRGLLLAKKQESLIKKETPAASNEPANIYTPTPASALPSTITENEIVISSETEISAPVPEAQPSPIIQEMPQTMSPVPTITPLITPQNQIVYVNIQGLGNFQVNLKDSDTAFSVLQRAAEENNFQVGYQNYGSLGIFVSCIANICQDKNHYWAFYHNDEYSLVGASYLKVYANDSTVWKLENY